MCAMDFAITGSAACPGIKFIYIGKAEVESKIKALDELAFSGIKQLKGIFFMFSYFICTPRDENSQGQPYKIIKHLFGDSLVILVSHHNAGFFTVFSS